MYLLLYWYFNIIYDSVYITGDSDSLENGCEFYYVTLYFYVIKHQIFEFYSHNFIYLLQIFYENKKFYKLNKIL